MAKGSRAIQTPGAVAPTAAIAADAGAAPSTGAGFDPDDLSEYDSEDLPPTEPPSAQELQQALAETLATNRKLAARLDRLEGKVPGGVAPAPVPTVAEAEQTALAMIRNGKRPRAILTDQGWYCHPEMARVKTHGAVEPDA